MLCQGQLFLTFVGLRKIYVSDFQTDAYPSSLPLPTYLPTYLLTYPPTHPPTYLPIYLPVICRLYHKYILFSWLHSFAVQSLTVSFPSIFVSFLLTFFLSIFTCPSLPFICADQINNEAYNSAVAISDVMLSNKGPFPVCKPGRKKKLWILFFKILKCNK